VTAPAIGRERLGATAWPGTDARRVLHLVLAAIWLLDGVLQYQSFMYTDAFGQMTGGTAAGNPGVIARPISWNAALVEHHLILLNTVFATLQLLLARSMLILGLVVAAFIWVFGEAFGQILAGGGTDPNSGPLLALLALVYWPLA